MLAEPGLRPTVPPATPLLRGLWHQWAFVAAIPLGAVLVLSADTGRARAAAGVFAASVAAMFGASALYHRVPCSPRRRIWLGRLDHAAIFGLIAGTYTPFGLLVLEGRWRTAVLAIVWVGSFTGAALKVLWPSSPRWTTTALGVPLGWVGIAAFPELLDEAGTAAAFLALAGGIFYTLGAVIYVVRKPDPLPAVFGFHEVFHACVIVAVAFQYAAVALVVA